MAKYPTDPSIPFQEILAFVADPNKDYKKLLVAVYDFMGYGMYLLVGNPTTEEVQKFGAMVEQIQATVLPFWLIPLVGQLLPLVSQLLLKLLTPKPSPAPAPIPPFNAPVG